MAGKERRVHVQASHGRQREERRRQDAPVGRDDHGVGREGGELLGDLRRAERRGLKDGDAVLPGPESDGGRCERAAAAGGAVRLGDHRRDLITGVKEG